MPEQSITCPKCGYKFAPTEVLRHEIEEELKARLELDFVKRQKTLEGGIKRREQEIKDREDVAEELEKSLRERVKIQVDAQIGKREKELEERERAAQQLEKSVKERVKTQVHAQLGKREKELEERERATEQLEKSVKERVKVQVDAQLGLLKKKAREEAENEMATAVAENDRKVKRLEGKVKEAQDRESKLREKAAKLEEDQAEFDLKVKRAFDDSSKQLEERVRADEGQKWEQHLHVKDEELERVRKALAQAQRAGESGEMLGEVAEKSLAERLGDAFPEDEVQPVARGKQGADVLQNVERGGSLLWESKDQYANWSNEWIPKLKRDRDAAKASVGILVTTVGPGSKPVKTPFFDDGVVITPPWAVVGVASMLRPQLAEVARQRRLYAKQESIQAEVYAWVTSEAFQRGIVAVLENLRHLESQVSRAKVNHSRWFKRMETDVDHTVRSLAEFYGTAQGHARLPDLPALELPGGESPETEDVNPVGSEDESKG